MTEAIQRLNFKVVMLGGSDAGKTSVLCSELGVSNPEQVTVFAEYKAKRYYINVNEEDVVVKLGIFDTSGQEKYRSVAPVYYRRADAGIFVVDLTNPESIQVLQKFYEDFELYAKETNKKLLLLNKQDLTKNNQISERLLNTIIGKYAFDIVYKTSAVTGEGINEAFLQLVKLLAVSKDDYDDQVYEHSEQTTVSLRQRSGIIINDVNDSIYSCFLGSMRRANSGVSQITSLPAEVAKSCMAAGQSIRTTLSL